MPGCILLVGGGAHLPDPRCHIHCYTGSLSLVVGSNVLVNYESEFQQRAAWNTKVTSVVSHHLWSEQFYNFDKDGQREREAALTWATSLDSGEDLSSLTCCSIICPRITDWVTEEFSNHFCVGVFGLGSVCWIGSGSVLLSVSHCSKQVNLLVLLTAIHWVRAHYAVVMSLKW